MPERPGDESSDQIDNLAAPERGVLAASRNQTIREHRDWFTLHLDVQIEPQFVEQFGRELTLALLDADLSMFVVLDGLVIVPRCDGSSDCKAVAHIEGCYAGDRDRPDPGVDAEHAPKAHP